MLTCVLPREGRWRRRRMTGAKWNASASSPTSFFFHLVNLYSTYVDTVFLIIRKKKLKYSSLLRFNTSSHLTWVLVTGIIAPLVWAAPPSSSFALLVHESGSPPYLAKIRMALVVKIKHRKYTKTHLDTYLWMHRLYEYNERSGRGKASGASLVVLSIIKKFKGGRGIASFLRTNQEEPSSKKKKLSKQRHIYRHAQGHVELHLYRHRLRRHIYIYIY